MVAQYSSNIVDLRQLPERELDAAIQEWFGDHKTLDQLHAERRKSRRRREDMAHA